MKWLDSITDYAMSVIHVNGHEFEQTPGDSGGQGNLACCSHELKICLLIVRKAMTNLDSILKSRDITLLTKVCIVKAIVFQ